MKLKVGSDSTILFQLLTSICEYSSPAILDLFPEPHKIRFIDPRHLAYSIDSVVQSLRGTHLLVGKSLEAWPLWLSDQHPPLQRGPSPLTGEETDEVSVAIEASGPRLHPPQGFPPALKMAVINSSPSPVSSLQMQISSGYSSLLRYRQILVIP